MGLTESGKLGVYRKKLQGICEEHNLTYRFIRDEYPIMLIIQTTGDVSGQMSMLEEEDGYRSPDAQLIFSFKDGDLSYRISKTFTIGDALFNRLKNLFRNMHSTWLQYYFRYTCEILTKPQMPQINDDGDSDIVPCTFDDVKDVMEPVEAQDGDTDNE